MVESSLYENKGDEMFEDIKNGAGFATYDYVLNAKHSPLSQKERLRLMIKLAKSGILVDDRKINGSPKEKSQVPKSSIMNVQDLEKRWKDRTNPNVNESNISFSKHSKLSVDVKLADGRTVSVSFTGGSGQPKYISFPGEKSAVSVFDKRGKEFIKKHGKEIKKWYNKASSEEFKKNNESVNESTKPNFNEFEPVSGKYDFKKLSGISDMGSKINISKKEFDEILKKIKKWGVDVFRDDHDSFWTIFSYGDNYNLVKVKINESSNREKDLDPGVVLKHKHTDGISIELVSPTKRGWKVKQSDSFAPNGRKLRKPKVTTQFYDSGNLKGDKSIFENINETTWVGVKFSKLMDKQPISKFEKKGAENWVRSMAKKYGEDPDEAVEYVKDMYAVSLSEANHGYQDGSAGYMKNHKDEYKMAMKINKKVGKKEIPFYDELSNLEDKLGHPKYMIWLSNSLRGFNVDMYKDPKIHNQSEGEEALFLLSK